MMFSPCRVNQAVTESFRLILCAHYLDPPESESAYISKVSKTLPDWVTCLLGRSFEPVNILEIFLCLGYCHFN